MQTALPFFPSETKLINATSGFREMNGIVYYMQYGKPIYCHDKNDHNSYRFALANLIHNQVCSIKDLSVALGVPRKNIERYAKALRDHGSGHFFGHTDGRGQCYKMTPDKLAQIQSDLHAGTSIYRTALNHDVSESAISYHIKKGTFKKS